MKKVLFTVLAGLLAGMTIIPARAADDADKMFEFNGEVRARYEYLNNYFDLTDNADGNPASQRCDGHRALPRHGRDDRQLREERHGARRPPVHRPLR